MPHSNNQFIEQAQKESFGTQALTQRKATQVSKEGSGDVLCLSSDDEEEPAGNVPYPTFEVFWQARCSGWSEVTDMTTANALASHSWGLHLTCCSSVPCNALSTVC
jgi:hypothetical protein